MDRRAIGRTWTNEAGRTYRNEAGWTARKKILSRRPGWPIDRYSAVNRVGGTIVVIGGGPSLTLAQIAEVRAAHGAKKVRVIAVNDAYLWAPFADVCYFGDERWYGWHTAGIARPKLGLSADEVRERFAGFAGQKCSASQTIGDHGVHVLRGGNDWSREPERICTKSNSGMQALNIATLAGDTVLLLGFDSRETEGGSSHWFGEHPIRVPDSVFPVFRADAKSVATEIKGARVLNCSPGSAIDAFERADLTTALAVIEQEGERGGIYSANMRSTHASAFIPDSRSIWNDSTVIVCASGPSMTQAVADAVRASGLTAIVTNDTWRLLPTADVLFAANADWWLKRNPRVSPEPDEFSGERICCQDGAPQGVVFIKPRECGAGGNSALRACHLAGDRGADRILLCGVDLREDQLTHWHGPHKGLSNPTEATFRRHLKAWERYAAETGRPEIINCNSESSVRCFPFGDLSLLEAELAV